MAQWGWEEPGPVWGERSGGPLHRRPTCAARASLAAFHRRGPLGPSPLSGAVTLTHGLGRLHLLVEPLAQDLRHGSAWASDG